MRTITGLLAAIAFVFATTAPALALSPLLSKTDPTGDVTRYKYSPISSTKQKSIDVDKISIMLLDSGKYRFKVRMKKLYSSSSWDQMVFFNSPVPDPIDAYDDQATISFRVRNSTAAYAYDPQSDHTCNLKVKRDGRTVWVDVPARCAPYDGQPVRADTYTGHWQSDEPPYSRDHVYVGAFVSE